MTEPNTTEPATEPGVQLEKRAPGSVESTVLEAELVEKLPRPGAVRVLLQVRYRTTAVVTTLGKTGPVAATGRVVSTSTRLTLRAGWTSAQGGARWVHRAGAALTHGPLRDQVRLAQIAGDRVALAEWSDRLEKAKDARLKRLLDLPKAVLALGIVGGVALALLWLLVALGGVAAQLAPGGLTWATWWAGVGQILDGVSVAAKALATLALVGAVPLAVVLAWREGRRVANPPLWLLTPAERARQGAEITPSKVVTALRDLGVQALRNAIKEMPDAGAGMLSPIVIAGCGVEVDVQLPSGVSTAEIQARRRKLAENHDRHEHEVFITLPPAPRTVRLWIAHPGALDEPIGPSPLILDPSLTADVYTGRAPWGQDLRGDAAAISLLQRHLLITGLSNQGKTASLRALVLWLALDVTVEFHIADLKGIGDWHMLAGITSTLIEGPSDDHVIAATEMLEAAVVEMERRLGALDKDRYPNGVTRDLARKRGSGFHQQTIIVDEAQQAFMCPAVDDYKRPYGGTKATSRYFMAARKLHNQGRAVNMLLWQGTQDPTDQNLPKLVREGAHIRACLAVGTEAQSRMALGDKAVDGGAAPHQLRQGLDKGTLVVAGDGVALAPGQSSATIRTHFIDGAAATELAQRAEQLRAKAGRHLTSVPVIDAEPVDHLADIHEALRGEAKVRTTVVLARLIEADPDVYESWDLGRLTEVLATAEAPTQKSHGLMYVVAKRVEQVLGEAG